MISQMNKIIEIVKIEILAFFQFQTLSWNFPVNKWYGQKQPLNLPMTFTDRRS